LPTDEAGLRALAEKGNIEAMYALGMLLDPIECTMDLESIQVTPSPGAAQTREAYKWYKAAARREHPGAYWKWSCMLMYPREGLDFTPEQRLDELFDVTPKVTNELFYGELSGVPGKYRRNVDLCYNLALCNYCGYAHAVSMDIQEEFDTVYLHYKAYEYASLVARKTDPSHEYHQYAETIMGETYSAWEIRQQYQQESSNNLSESERKELDRENFHLRHPLRYRAHRKREPVFEEIPSHSAPSRSEESPIPQPIRPAHE
jgi:TPR repeat protein